MKESELAALKIAKDPEAIHFLHELEKGHGFKKISRDAVLQSSCIGIISMKNHNGIDFLQGGRAVQRVWLEANYNKISFQPISQLIFLKELLLSKDASVYNNYEKNEIEAISKRLEKLLSFENSRHPIFIFRLSLSGEPLTRALRRPIKKQLFIHNSSI